MDKHIDRVPQMLGQMAVRLTPEQQAAFVAELRHNYELYPRTPLRDHTVAIKVRPDGTVISYPSHPGYYISRNTQGNTGRCTSRVCKHSAAHAEAMLSLIHI